MTIIANFVLFQIGWFAVVLAGGSSWHLLGTICVVAIVGWHILRAHRPATELLFIAVATLLGAVWESLLVAQQLLSYGNGQLHPALAPHWIVAMWALFATTCNLSLRWLQQRYFVAMLFGAIGGPMAFLAGEKLGAVTLNEPYVSLLVLLIGWALLTPLLLWLAQRYNGYATPEQSEVTT